MIFVTTGTILNENLNNNYNPNIQKLYSFFFFFRNCTLICWFFKKNFVHTREPFLLTFLFKTYHHVIFSYHSLNVSTVFLKFS